MRHLTPSMVVALVALTVALGGSATAALVISGSNVRNGSLTGADIKNRSIKTADLATSARRAGSTGPAGAAGAVGPPGPAGAKGDKGDPGTPGTNGTNGTNGGNGVSRAVTDVATAQGLSGAEAVVASIPVTAGQRGLATWSVLMNNGNNDVARGRCRLDVTGGGSVTDPNAYSAGFGPDTEVGTLQAAEELTFGSSSTFQAAAAGDLQLRCARQSGTTLGLLEGALSAVFADAIT